MKAVFIELPPFERYRSDYLSDDDFKDFQQELMVNPQAGDVIKGSGGLRKVRFKDQKHGTRKRGGCELLIIGGWVALSSGCLPYTVKGK